MTALRPSKLWLLALAVILCAVAAYVVQSLSTDSPVATAQQGQSMPLDTALGRYTVFGRAATADDDVSRWPIPAPAVREDGLQLDRARVVYADAYRTVAAVPSADGTCIAQRHPDGGSGLSCGGADRPTIVVGYHGAIGLMPDSVKTVTFTMTDGTTHTQPVVNNVWHSPDEAAAATYTLLGKERRVELMPRSSLPAGAKILDSGLVTSSH